MNKEQKISEFDPSGPANVNNNIFGLPFTFEESKVIIMPVPWDLTASNKSGTSLGPQIIKKESFQIDLFDQFAPDAWKNGIYMEDIPQNILMENDSLRTKAEDYIKFLESGASKFDTQTKNNLDSINIACNKMISGVEQKAISYLNSNKLLALIGGDHSTALALIRALAVKHDNFGILQFDAHADLRDSYEGFEHSHASVMFNAMKINSVSKLVQVGIRDYCQEEYEFIENNKNRVKLFTAPYLYKKSFEGISWKSICSDIISELPDKVYITYDVDFLDPADCPNTGTPVPGGLAYEQALYLIELLVENNKTIIGFDLVETGNGDIDGVVSCRILYRIINAMLKSNNL